jgi:membrane protein implicated in regulation of membrane protease activity
MIKINKNDIIKKCLPVFGLVFIVVLTIGLIFGSSFPQIVSSIVVSALLIFSAMFFRSVGRGRESESEKNNTADFKSNDEPK